MAMDQKGQRPALPSLTFWRVITSFLVYLTLTPKSFAVTMLPLNSPGFVADAQLGASTPDQVHLWADWISAAMVESGDDKKFDYDISVLQLSSIGILSTSIKNFKIGLRYGDETARVTNNIEQRLVTHPVTKTESKYVVREISPIGIFKVDEALTIGYTIQVLSYVDRISIVRTGGTEDEALPVFKETIIRPVPSLVYRFSDYQLSLNYAPWAHKSTETGTAREPRTIKAAFFMTQGDRGYLLSLTQRAWDRFRETDSKMLKITLGFLGKVNQYRIGGYFAHQPSFAKNNEDTNLGNLAVDRLTLTFESPFEEGGSLGLTAYVEKGKGWSSQTIENIQGQGFQNKSEYTLDSQSISLVMSQNF